MTKYNAGFSIALYRLESICVPAGVNNKSWGFSTQLVFYTDIDIICNIQQTSFSLIGLFIFKSDYKT